MRKLSELNNILPDEYKKLYDVIIDYLDLYVFGKYYYLGVPLASWENLFVNIIIKIFKEERKFNPEIFSALLIRKLNLAIGNHIKSCLLKGNVLAFNGLLIKLETSGYKGERLLAMFICDLQCLGIDFTENCYNLLREKSPIFRSLIENAKLLNYEEFMRYLNKKYELNINVDKLIKEGKDDLTEEEVENDLMQKYSHMSLEEVENDLMQKYSHMSLEEVKNLFGGSYFQLPKDNIILLNRFFAPKKNQWFLTYEAEKQINLISYGYKRRNINLSKRKLKQSYLMHNCAFNEEEILYLKCYVFEICDKAIFEEKYPNSKIVMANIIFRLEKLYYDVDTLFNFNSKEKSEINKDFYIPYILDRKYELHEVGREVLRLLLIEDLSYKEISNKLGIKENNVPNFVSDALYRIDCYRFGIDRSRFISKQELDEFFGSYKDDLCEKVVRLKYQDYLDNDLIAKMVSLDKGRLAKLLNDFTKNFILFQTKNITIDNKEIMEEIERHPSNSVLSDIEKEIVSYYFGIKSKFNITGKKLIGKAINEEMNITGNMTRKVTDAILKLKRRKIGDLSPSLIYMDRDELEKVLQDQHLPITKEDKEIICYLLGLNGYTLKSIEELGDLYGLKENGIKRKYKMAIINIRKYLNGEKEGNICYEIDILPNLKYFTSMERKLLEDYYLNNLLYKDIAQKYKEPLDKIQSVMQRIRNYLKDIISNPDKVRFDYDYYHKVVDKPDFPFRGDIELAKRIFDLYVGEQRIGRLDFEEIKRILGINLQSYVISRMIKGLILDVFKYKDGIRKEKTFSYHEIRDFYLENKDNLSLQELELFKHYFDKSVGRDYKTSEDLTFLLLKNKYPDYYKLGNMSKDEVIKFLNKYADQISNRVRTIIMTIKDITERDLMSQKEIKEVLEILKRLDQSLMVEENKRRA